METDRWAVDERSATSRASPYPFHQPEWHTRTHAQEIRQTVSRLSEQTRRVHPQPRETFSDGQTNVAGDTYVSGGKAVSRRTNEGDSSAAVRSAGLQSAHDLFGPVFMVVRMRME